MNPISIASADRLHEVHHATISLWAVSSLALCGVSLTGFISPVLGGFVIPSVIAGAWALVGIHKYELHGRWLAKLGIGFSLLLAVMIPVWHHHLFHSEATAGTIRLNFDELSRDNGFERYVGQRVCLKGYAFPKAQREVSSFLMTLNGVHGPDAVYIEVQLPSSETWKYQWKPQAVSGVLSPHTKASEKQSPRWILLNSEVRPSMSRHQLAKYAGRDGC